MNSCQAPPQACVLLWFEQVRQHPKLTKNYPMVIVSSGAQWFEEVRLNNPELMSMSCLVPCVVLWFEQVRKRLMKN